MSLFTSLSKALSSLDFNLILIMMAVIILVTSIVLAVMNDCGVIPKCDPPSYLEQPIVIKKLRYTDVW